MKVKFKSQCQRLGKREPNWMFHLSKRAELITNNDITDFKKWNLSSQRPSMCLSYTIERLSNGQPINSELKELDTDFDQNLIKYLDQINEKNWKNANTTRYLLQDIIKKMRKIERKLVTQHLNQINNE